MTGTHHTFLFEFIYVHIIIASQHIPGIKEENKGFKGFSPREANLPMPLFLQAATTRRSHVRSAGIDHLDVSCDIRISLLPK